MTSKKSQRVVPWNKATVQGEAREIVSRATDHAVTIVTLGPLVFFATATGDAWMLDSQEEFALCLARAGCEQDYRISETPDQFSVDWQASYRFDGDVMIVREPGDRLRSIIGYPVDAIRKAIQDAQGGLPVTRPCTRRPRLRS